MAPSLRIGSQHAVRRCPLVGRGVRSSPPRPQSAIGPRLAGVVIPSPRLLALISILTMSLAACGPAGGTGTAPPAATPAATAPAATAPLSTAADGPAVSQTETDWGSVWDAVPNGFPRYPGSASADDAGAGPVSAAYAVRADDPAEVASWFQTHLEVATYSTEAMSGPFEDGSFVIDSVGDGACRIQTTVAPLGGLLLVTVLYGAACPAP
jgi:hypothetical protein